MDRWEGKVAVVTGASSGIGVAIAESLVKAGLLVVGLARRSDRLEKLSASLEGAGGKLYARQCDVAEEEDLVNAFKWTNAELGGVDVLVNNAGLAHNSTIIGGEVETFRNISDVNVLATAISIRSAVASMKSRDAPGYIININSILGHEIPSARLSMNLYASSKYAITALIETVRKLSAEPNTKIKVTSISPGLVKTEIIDAPRPPGYRRCSSLPSGNLGQGPGSFDPRRRADMDRWEGKVAVVTGASGGIGAAITKSLVKAGLLLVGLDMRLNILQELSANLRGARGKLYPRQCDVTKEKELLEAFRWVNTELGGVDILVNNAGVGKNTRIIDDDVESFRRILDVNVLAPTICSREAVASIRSRDVPGYIININSVVGHEIPDASLKTSLYTPSKYAVTALTETLRKELSVDRNNKIRITSISPGLVKTGIHEAAGFPKSSAIYDAYPHLDPQDIADAVLYVLGTRDKVQVSELTIRPAGEP